MLVSLLIDPNRKNLGSVGVSENDPKIELCDGGVSSRGGFWASERLLRGSWVSGKEKSYFERIFGYCRAPGSPGEKNHTLRPYLAIAMRVVGEAPESS